ncbi:MAG: NrfD/PsrC family molybdoenzyme membrane anchor subunit, partial [Planctomycetota bacterium]
WGLLKELITGRLLYSYVFAQLLLCSLGPFVLLSITVLGRLRPPWSNALIFSSAVLLLSQVLLMRWNVVIGGQLVSKSFRGFTTYLPGLFDREGLMMAVVILIIPFVLLRFFDRLFPFFPAAPTTSDLQGAKP